MNNDDLVPVMVPKYHLPKVYAYLGQLAEPSSEEPPPSKNDGSDAHDDWTQSRIERMVRESQAAMTDILRAMAERAGAWVSTHDLAAAIRSKPDADWNTVAGTMGAFGRRVKNRYGIKANPFDKRYNHDAGCKEFCMPIKIAKIVMKNLNKPK